MGKLEFTGIQHIDRRNNLINIGGYIQILPSGDELSVPIRGLINIKDKENLTYEFTGSIKQVVIDIPPQITFYIVGNLGKELFYRFKNRSILDKLSYSGFWCPINKETQHEIMMPYGEPSISKYAMLEFVLETSELRKIGLLL
jgi:hypothetical protein